MYSDGIGAPDLETLIRSTYAGHALNRANGQNVDYANITDVPSYPWAYASVLHAAGVKYFAAAGNPNRGPRRSKDAGRRARRSGGRDRTVVKC